MKINNFCFKYDFTIICQWFSQPYAILVCRLLVRCIQYSVTDLPCEGWWRIASSVHFVDVSRHINLWWDDSEILCYYQSVLRWTCSVAPPSPILKGTKSDQCVLIRVPKCHELFQHQQRQLCMTMHAIFTRTVSIMNLRCKNLRASLLTAFTG